MKYVYQQPALESELLSATKFEVVEAALTKIIQLRTGFRGPEIYGRTLFTPGFDNAAVQTARKLKLRDRPGRKSNENVCIVGTAFYGTGGHSRVAADIITRLGERQKPVLINTDVYKERAYRMLLNDANNNSGLGERACLRLSAETNVEKAIELYMMLTAIRPSRIILMCHPMDIVAVIATWPFRDVVDFVHHADHIPAIGAALPFSAHIDLTYTCHLVCKKAGRAPLYAGMTSTITQPSTHRTDPTHLRFAVCGSPHKFDGGPRFKWADYVVAALKRPGSEFLHIGPTTPEFDSAIQQALTAAEIDPARYVVCGYQPNLPAELVSRQVDIYISSFPEPGGKANLEAMLAGIPVILPTDPNSPPLTRFSLPLERYVDITRPDQLPKAIDQALAMRATFASPDQQATVARELARFDDYVAGRRPSATEAVAAD